MIYTQNSLDLEVIKELDHIKEEFVNSIDFKEYKRLEALIYEKYAKEIMSFNNAKESLEETKKYHLELKDKEEALSKAKALLYSKKEVIELKKLENKLQSDLDQISNSIAEHFSNKFKKKRVL